MKHESDGWHGLDWRNRADRGTGGSAADARGLELLEHDDADIRQDALGIIDALTDDSGLGRCAESLVFSKIAVPS
jgi:hypothetical protein